MICIQVRVHLLFLPVHLFQPNGSFFRGLQTAVLPRRRPKGHTGTKTQLTEFEKQQLALLECDIKNREDYMQQMLIKEERKLALLEKLVPNQ